MKLQPRHHRTAASDNNLIPMINVVFLLLIFFMVAGNIRVSDPLPLVAPESTQNQPVTAESTLYVASDGTLILDQQEITMASLAAQLEALPENSETSSMQTDNTTQPPTDETPNSLSNKPRLAIKADARVPVSLLRDIMSIIREAGMQRVELLTIKAASNTG